VTRSPAVQDLGGKTAGATDASIPVGRGRGPRGLGIFGVQEDKVRSGKRCGVRAVRIACSLHGEVQSLGYPRIAGMGLCPEDGFPAKVVGGSESFGLQNAATPAGPAARSGSERKLGGASGGARQGSTIGNKVAEIPPVIAEIVDQARGSLPAEIVRTTGSRPGGHEQHGLKPGRMGILFRGPGLTPSGTGGITGRGAWREPWAKGIRSSSTARTPTCLRDIGLKVGRQQLVRLSVHPGARGTAWFRGR
jgi:hypothetical protein